MTAGRVCLSGMQQATGPLRKERGWRQGVNKESSIRDQGKCIRRYDAPCGVLKRLVIA
jgi:hypothetical protein